MRTTGLAVVGPWKLLATDDGAEEKRLISHCIRIGSTVGIMIWVAQAIIANVSFPTDKGRTQPVRGDLVWPPYMPWASPPRAQGHRPKGPGPALHNTGPAGSCPISALRGRHHLRAFVEAEPDKTRLRNRLGAFEMNHRKGHEVRVCVVVVPQYRGGGGKPFASFNLDHRIFSKDRMTQQSKDFPR